MRALLFFTISTFLFGQNGTDFDKALAGQWVGTLEYRDYSEPAGSAKRVKLPTWLAIEQLEQSLLFNYIYDDGPSKTVTETSSFRVDGAKALWGKENFAIEGLDQLRQGRGILMLRGAGTENNVPVEVKTTIRIGRNILEITRETGPTGQPLVFRHSYTLVRALPLAVH